MRIAILSDIHDNIWTLAAALRKAESAEALLCCGDLCSPFIVHQLGRGFAGPIHIVFGNNDGDLFRITSAARNYPQISIHGHLFQGQLDGRRVAMNHYPDIALPMAASGQFDVVCYGHNHVHKIHSINATVAINPGTVMGAVFGPDGAPVAARSTFVIYDSDAGRAETHEIEMPQ